MKGMYLNVEEVIEVIGNDHLLTVLKTAEELIRGIVRLIFIKDLNMKVCRKLVLRNSQW